MLYSDFSASATTGALPLPLPPSPSPQRALTDARRQLRQWPVLRDRDSPKAVATAAVAMAAVATAAVAVTALAAAAVAAVAVALLLHRAAMMVVVSPWRSFSRWSLAQPVRR